MTKPRRIESPANPRVKSWRALQERRARDRTGTFIIEGTREASRAAAAGISVIAMLTDEDASPAARHLASQCADNGAEYFIASRPVMERLSRRQRPPDLIAIAEQPNWTLDSIGVAAPSLVVIADSIEKPGNLGAMIRTADGAGADALVVSDPATDPANPNVIRASQGALFALPVAAAPAQDVSRWAEEQGLRVLVASAVASSDLWQTDLTMPTAVVIGSEASGASDHWSSYEGIAIPMAGISDSLNASVAAALCLYEAVRQRRG